MSATYEMARHEVVELEVLADYYREHGYWPSVSDRDRGVAHLGLIMATMRAAHRNRTEAFPETLPAARIAWLEDRALPWHLTRRPESIDQDAMSQEILDYLERHGRLPTVRNPDPSVSRLGAALGRARRALRNNTQGIDRERAEYLDARGALSSAARSAEHGDGDMTAQRCEQWLTERGKWPSRNGRTDAERVLGGAMTEARSAERSGDVSPLVETCIRYWDERGLPWRDAKHRRDGDPVSRAVVNFWIERGVMPSDVSQSKDERSLARAVRRTREAQESGERLTELQRARIEVWEKWGVPWSMPRSVADALVGAQRAGDHFERHGTWPSKHSVHSEAATLGNALEFTRRIYRQGRRSPLADVRIEHWESRGLPWLDGPTMSTSILIDAERAA